VIESYLRATRRFSRNARLYLVTTAIYGFAGWSGIYGVLLSLYLLRLGYGSEFIGLVTAMSPLSSVVFSLPASVVGRRWGYRRVMLVGAFLLIAGNGLLPLAEFLQRGAQDEWIVVTYLISGLGVALYLVNLTPSIMAATTPVERNHVFSVRIGLLPLSGFAGSLAGGALPGLFSRLLGISLDDPAPYRYPLWIATLLLSPAMWMLWATREAHPERDKRGAFKLDARDKVLLKTRSWRGVPIGVIVLLSFVGFLRVAGEGAPRTFFNVYLDVDLGVPTAQIGVLMALGRLLAVSSALVAPVMMARRGKARTVVLGALGVALGLLPMSLVPHWVAAGLGFAAMTSLAAISRSAFIVYIMEAVPPRWQGLMSAATTMSAALSWSLTSMIGGYLVHAVGYRGLFALGAGLTTAGALLFEFAFVRNRWREREG
jgi:MFS family permease